MKKILFTMLLLSYIILLSACEITTTDISMNTALTQSTTTSTSLHVPVTHIELILNTQELCEGDQITLTVNITPTNATNQGYTITLNQNTYVDFANPNNQLILEIISSNANNITETQVTATSDDNNSINDTQQVYVHPPGSSGCPLLP